MRYRVRKAGCTWIVLMPGGIPCRWYSTWRSAYRAADYLARL